jgi:hypothetical protein
MDTLIDLFELEETGRFRALLHLPDTCMTNILNSFLQGSHSPVPTLHAPWTGFFFRMRIISRIMPCWNTASHTLHNPGSSKFERFGEAGGTVGPYTAPNVRTRDFGIVRQVQSLTTRTLKGGECIRLESLYQPSLVT